MQCQRYDRHFSPFTFACYTNATECFKVLLQHSLKHVKEQITVENEWFGTTSDRVDCLFNVIKNDNAELLRVLTSDLKTPIDVKDENGATVMHQAAKYGSNLMIYMLAEMGCNVNAVDNKANTPLHTAVRNNQVTSANFLASLGASLLAQDCNGKTVLHMAVEANNIRICKDMCLKGADRNLKDSEGRTAETLARSYLKGTPDQSRFINALSAPWYIRLGCPVAKLPLVPAERNARYEITFLILFIFIWLNNIFVIEPVLDVWYFMCSTTLCMSKLALTYYAMSKKPPGYVEQDKSLDWSTVLKTVPHEHLCFECKVIRAPRTHHCHVCKKCVDRWDSHSFWTNNCVGRKNAGFYFAWIFYVWLNTFLLGWIAMATIPILECELLVEGRQCVYHALCVGCNNPLWHNFVCYFDMIVCFAFMVPATYHLWIQSANFCKNETTYERFARKNRRVSALTADDSFDHEGLNSDDDETLLPPSVRRRGKSGCWANCGQMCCNKQVVG